MAESLFDREADALNTNVGCVLNIVLFDSGVEKRGTVFYFSSKSVCIILHNPEPTAKH